MRNTEITQVEVLTHIQNSFRIKKHVFLMDWKKGRNILECWINQSTIVRTRD